MIWLYLAAFIATALVEGGWVASVAAVRTGSPFQAALLAGGMTLLVAGATVLYTEHRALVAPTAAGASFGAFWSVWWLRRRGQ